MSPRAACRLESLGFTAVYDYTSGKSDWLAAGLPTEGPAATTPRPGNLIRTPVPTCSLNDTVATARQRSAQSGVDRCIVISDSRVVLGVLVGAALAGDPQSVAAEVMRAGPATVRAHEELVGLLGRMHARNVTTILVTDPEGRLLGLLHRDDAEAALERQHRMETGPEGRRPSGD